MGHEDAVYLAKLAEQAERYEGMLQSAGVPPLSLVVGADNLLSHRDGREHEDRCLRGP